MIRVIMGKKGSGKTKQMIEMINNAVQTEHGNVVLLLPAQRTQPQGLGQLTVPQGGQQGMKTLLRKSSRSFLFAVRISKLF